jgi:hypothetical protein
MSAFAATPLRRDRLRLVGCSLEKRPRRKRGLDEARAEGASEVWRGGRDSNPVHRALVIII